MEGWGCLYRAPKARARPACFYGLGQVNHKWWVLTFLSHCDSCWPFKWPNKGSQICFYLDVSQRSVRFRINLSRRLFQEAGFQHHRASVCLSTSPTPVGIMSWVQAWVEKRVSSMVWDPPKTKTQHRHSPIAHNERWVQGPSASCVGDVSQWLMCLCIVFVCWIV